MTTEEAKARAQAIKVKVTDALVAEYKAWSALLKASQEVCDLKIKVNKVEGKAARAEGCVIEALHSAVVK